MRLYKLVSLLLFFTAISLSFGFGSKKNQLQLENVLQYEAERKAKKKDLPLPSPAPSISEKKVASPQQTPAKKSLLPDELNLFKVPKGFHLQTDLLSEEDKTLLRFKFPGAAAFWISDTSSVRIIAGNYLTDGESIQRMGKKSFLEELEKTAKQYDDFYKKNEQSRALHQIDEIGNLFRLKITSKYVAENKWLTDTKLFYFYRPDYRLTFMITGSDSDLSEIQGNLQNALADFEKSLQKIYPLGISFTQDTDS